MSLILFIFKIVLVAYILTILREVISSRKRFPLYIVLISVALLAKILIMQGVGFSSLYLERFNFFSPLYYVGESFLAFVFSAAILSQSESPDKFRRYMILNGLVFTFFFCIGFVILHYFFVAGILTVSIEYEMSGAVKIIRFTDAYKHFNKSYILVNLIDFSFTLFWIFNTLHILFQYIYTIIMLRGRKTENSEQNILLERARIPLITAAVIGLFGILPARIGFEIASVGILVSLAVVRARMGGYFKYEQQAYDNALIRKQEIIRRFREDVPQILLREYAERLCAAAVEVADANAVGVYRVDETEGTLQPQAFVGPFPPLFPIDEAFLRGNRSLSVVTHKVATTPVQLEGVFLEQVIRERGRLLLADALHHPEVPQYAHRLLNIETLMAVVFAWQDTKFILIAANTREGNFFSDAQLELLVSLVGSAGEE